MAAADANTKQAGFGANLLKKPYGKALKDLFETTAVMASDIDAKAVQLLDALQASERAEAAIATVKEGLGAVEREKVKNWRAYFFTFLRKYDKELYEKMREERGKPNPRRKDSKQQEQEVGPYSFNKDAPVFVPGQTWLPPAEGEQAVAAS